MIHNKDICIFTPCTRQEYRSGELEHSTLSYLELAASKKYSFDFVFCFNKPPEKKDENYKLLEGLNKYDCVNSVKWMSLNLRPEDDVYIKPTYLNPDPLDLKTDKPKKIPDFGASSGPNLSFYKSLLWMLEEYKSYKYFFMFEIDSYPCSENWMDAVIEDCKGKNFLIAGSRYKGSNKWHYCLSYKNHLNGVAVYKNSKLLKDLILESMEFHKLIISKKEWLINFDVAIDRYIRQPLNTKWKHKLNLFLDLETITNVSDPVDAQKSINEILEDRPDTVIIHQKNLGISSDTAEEVNFFPKIDLNFSKRNQKIPLFLHFPRCGGTTNIGWSTIIFHEFCKRFNLEIISKGTIPKLRIKRIHCDVNGISEIIFFVYDKSLCLNGHPSFATNSIRRHKYIKGGFSYSGDPYFCKGNLKDLKPLFSSGDLELFCAQVSPQSNKTTSNPRLGIKAAIDVIEEVGAEPLIYCALRQPFDLTKSFYFNWHKDKKSTNYSDFISFLQGFKLQDSLIIRYLTGLQNGQEIEFPHFKECHRILSQSMCEDIENITPLISKVFELSHGLSIENLPRILRHSDTNRSDLPFFLQSIQLKDLKNIKYEQNEAIDLNQYYEGRTYFAQMLYDNLVKK